MTHFRSKTVSKITGVTQRQLGYWDFTDFIKPSISGARGQGSTRLYSFGDLIQIKVASQFLERGLSLQRIRKCLNYLRRHMPDVERPLAQVRLLTDGETIFLLTHNQRAMLDTLRQGQFVFSVAIDQIVDELHGDVERHLRRKTVRLKVGQREFKVELRNIRRPKKVQAVCEALPDYMSEGKNAKVALAKIKSLLENPLAASNRRLKYIRKVR